MDLKTQELINKGEMLPLMEEFYTISRGRSTHRKLPLILLELVVAMWVVIGVMLKKVGTQNLHPPTMTDIIVQNAKKYAETVVITGGEPLMWSLDYITNQLQEHGMKTHIETSGAYDFSGVWDWFCLSPKKTKLPTKECYREADELKMIIHNKK